MNVKRCCGYEGRWECGKDYPDHMVPREKFHRHLKNSSGLQDNCKKCHRYSVSLEKHPITGELKRNWKTNHAKSLGGVRDTPEWKSYLDRAEKQWKVDSQIGLLTKKIKSKTKELTYDNVIQYVETKSKGRKRDAKVVSYIRSVYDSCSVVGCNYPEYDVAHIHALKHGANDLPENCLALCPNHHRDLDRGRMINLQQLNVGGYIYFGEEDDRKGIKLKHKVDSKYLDQCNIELENWKNAINKIQSGNDRPSIAVGK